MNRTQISILKQAGQVGFGGLLQCPDGSGLESQVRLNVLGDLADEALEGQLADEEFGRFLVFADFTEGHSSRTTINHANQH